MECRCNDHLPGNWHSHKDCDCDHHDHPAYSFVVTKVMEEDPGTGTAFISTEFMEKLGVVDGDPVEVVGAGGLVIQARSHPNPWIETRMIALDRRTMDKLGARLFAQIKLRKTVCKDSECVTLEVPLGASVTRRQLQAMLDKAHGAVVGGAEAISLTGSRGEDIVFRVVRCEPDTVTRISPATRIELVDCSGEPYVSKKETTFNEVGGLEDAIRKVREVVQLPLRHPRIFQRLGIDPPRGVLLHGPSGTGKTLIARAVAGETGCWFKAVSGTEIMDKHYGESEAKLRAAFEEAYKNAPAIIFIDEIDALAPRRDTAEGEVERRVTAQLLALMDGMDDRGDVIVLAATNLPNVLDNALRRPGRFDREINIGVPDRTGRKHILAIHTQDMPLGHIDLDQLADKLHGFVGADIKALCREAAYKALRRILPGLEDTDQELTEDFLEALRVENEDFVSVLREMMPSSARNFEVNLHRAGWDRIAGYEAEIEFLKDVVLWPLQNVSFLSGIGVNHLTGLLITGPSGTGKTLMAATLAKESGFNVIEIRGGELLSKYMGESEKNIRELFRQARQLAPAVVILDGIDAMASSGWSDSKVIDRVVSQLAMEMNNINSSQPILVAATCAKAADLPPALRATGKFGTVLDLRPPDAAERGSLFRLFLDRDRISFSGSYERIADASNGLTGGDIEEICRRSVLHVARETLDRNGASTNGIQVSEDDVLKALDKWNLSAAWHGRRA